MENASKALIIAASTLIALMVLASMVYLFREGVKLNEHFDANQIQRNLELYNSKFLKYNKDDNSIADIISVCNLAYDTNTGNEYDENWKVKIEIKVSPGNIFTVSDNIADDKGRNKIKFGENNEYSIYNLTTEPLGEGNLKLGETKFIDSENKQVYYFLFECKDVTVNKVGRVNYMRFECKKNPEAE